MGIFINDGYTTQHKIPARPPLPAIEFTYRPALFEEAQDYRRSLGATGADQVKAIGKLLASHVVAWDVLDENKTMVPITADVFRRIPESILLDMVRVVLDYPTAESDRGN